MTRYAHIWVAGLVVAALLSACQGAQTAPVAEATLPPATRDTSAAVTPAPSRYTTLFIQSASLSNNQIGEKTQRAIGVYLPPSYFTSDTRYPVVYYLPGYTDTAMLGFNLPGDADRLIRSGAMHEMIIVVANGTNQLGGSFYVNSPVTGNWEDVIVKDVVDYIDSTYRTIAQANARAISGHSMGGFGALHIGMRHPDIFSVVYSLSPGLFDPNGLTESQLFASETTIEGFLRYQQRLEALGVEEARRSMLYSPDDFTLAYGLAFVPNLEKQPPFMDYPYSEVDGQLVRNTAIWQKWEAGFGGIADKVQQYKDNLLQLNGLVIDYGRNDGYAWIPKGCDYLGEQLTVAGIPHELRSHPGDHESRLGERIGSYMLPFLSERLMIE